MALSRVDLYAVTSGNAHGTGSYTTASFSVTSGRLYVVRVSAQGSNNDALAGGDITLTSSIGLTFTSRVVSTTHPGWGYGDRVWTAVAGSSGTTTLTVDAGTFAVENYRVEVYEYQGFDSSSPVGATAVGSASNTQNGAVSITLSGAPASTSEVLAFVSMAIGGTPAGGITAGTGWSARYSISRDDWWKMQAQSRSGSTSTTVGWDDVNDNNVSQLGATLIALEIKEAPAGSPFNLDDQGPIGITGTMSIQGDVQIEAVIDVAAQGAIGMVGSMAISGDIAFQIKKWRVPTNAPQSTAVHVIVFSGSGPTYSILAQGDATVDASGFADIAAVGTIGTKAFAFVHNYDDNTETTSIYGGPAIATIVDAG